MLAACILLMRRLLSVLLYLATWDITDELQLFQQLDVDLLLAR
jgi:hypothetical protein